MPTDNRRVFIKSKARIEFKNAMNETNFDRVFLLFRLGFTQLETVEVQVENLRKYVPDDRIETPETNTVETLPQDTYIHNTFQNDTVGGINVSTKN